MGKQLLSFIFHLDLKYFPQYDLNDQCCTVMSIEKYNVTKKFFLGHKLFLIVHYCITDKNFKINAIVFLCFSTGHLLRWFHSLTCSMCLTKVSPVFNVSYRWLRYEFMFMIVYVSDLLLRVLWPANLLNIISSIHRLWGACTSSTRHWKTFLSMILMVIKLNLCTDLLSVSFI